jgi:predicted DsbA family dithiol-disulfide isomerase
MVAVYGWNMSDITDLTVHIDPLCPWAWLTSRWLAEVGRVRPVRVTTRLFSLAEVHRHDDLSEAGRRGLAAGETAMRVMVAARRAEGDGALARLYTELGEAHHERGEPLGQEDVLRRAVTASGLDPALVASAATDPTTLTELLDEHRAVAAQGAFGVPTLVLDGHAPIFGPCLDTRIGGDDAGDLWDRVAWLVRADHFFELKRDRPAPDVGRHRAGAAAG